MHSHDRLFNDTHIKHDGHDVNLQRLTIEHMPKKNIPNKIAKVLLLCLFEAMGFDLVAAEISPKGHVTVSVHKQGETFHVDASYEARMNACNAFAFITDYEAAKNIQGIVESKIISRTGNKVVVERTAKETILFFPLQISSTIEYTERPYQGLDFEQIRGDNKLYKGTWRLESTGDATKFTYQSQLELNLLVPSNVLEYFVMHSIKKRFESMAAMAVDKSVRDDPRCH